jgi:hypothetical protein
MVSNAERAPTAIVVSASAFWLGATADESSPFLGPPHRKQKGIQCPCTRAWERRCWHIGVLLIASASLAFAYCVVSRSQSVVLQPGDVWVARETA